MTLVRVEATGMCKPCGNIQRVYVDGEWRECQDCAGKEGGVTTRDEAEERRLVDQLRSFQMAKLHRYRSKGHWGDESIIVLYWQAYAEMQELLEEVAKGAGGGGNALAIAYEAADVANICAMIADIALSREGA
jgi:hypothetical protein